MIRVKNNCIRELEFLKKLRRASKTRMKGYEDIKINKGDWVFYQYQDKKAWLGPEKCLQLMVVMYSFLQIEILGRFWNVMFSYLMMELRLMKVNKERMKQ